MRSNGITTVLNLLLAFGLLAALILCVQYVRLTRAYRAETAMANGIREWQAVMRAFATDCVTYSKTNPDIIPILDTVGWTSPGPAPAAPVKPATKK